MPNALAFPTGANGPADLDQNNPLLRWFGALPSQQQNHLLMLIGSQPHQDTDAPWVQSLKRLVQPNVDPQMLRNPLNSTTDPGLNRQGPRIGDVLGI